jgi:hypothetical protein
MRLLIPVWREWMQSYYDHLDAIINQWRESRNGREIVKAGVMATRAPSFSSPGQPILSLLQLVDEASTSRSNPRTRRRSVIAFYCPHASIRQPAALQALGRSPPRALPPSSMSSRRDPPEVRNSPAAPGSQETRHTSTFVTAA